MTRNKLCYSVKPISTFQKGDTHYTRHDNIFDVFIYEIPKMGQNGKWICKKMLNPMDNKYDIYHWFTSNGNIYEYRLS